MAPIEAYIGSAEAGGAAAGERAGEAAHRARRAQLAERAARRAAPGRGSQSGLPREPRDRQLTTVAEIYGRLLAEIDGAAAVQRGGAAEEPVDRTLWATCSGRRRRPRAASSRLPRAASSSSTRPARSLLAAWERRQRRHARTTPTRLRWSTRSLSRCRRAQGTTGPWFCSGTKRRWRA